MMFIYTLLTTATLAAITISKQAVVSHDGLERSCQRVNQSCSGFSQDQANATCCSEYCHVMSVDRSTGRMVGLCERSCQLEGQTCSGPSQYRADAQCCSGSCDVLSVDADLNVYGECQKPPCQPLGATCQGRTFGEADAQCCSDRCDYLVQDKFGVYHGHCYKSRTASDSVAERTVVNEQRAEEKSTSAEGAPTPVANPIVANPITTPLTNPVTAPVANPITTPVTNPVTTPVANPITGPSCTVNGQYCSGASQAEGDSQCCSGYCKFTVNEYHFFTGTCQDRPTQRNLNNPIYAPVTKPKPSASCRRDKQSCEGFSQGEADSQCCTAYCHVMSMDSNTGRMIGLCEEGCRLVGIPCSGSSQYRADAECCSGSCNVLSVDAKGKHSGKCQSAEGAPTPVANPIVANPITTPVTNPITTPVANPITGPASCQRVNQSCSGFSQDSADSQCCSEYCHVMDVDRATGRMVGLCETSCQLEGQTCSGASPYRADAQCCSGSCDVLSVDKEGTHFGHCVKASCQPLGATCQGRTFGEADSQCCSGNCNNLLLKDGVYYGSCDHENAGKLAVVQEEKAEAKAAVVENDPGSCRKNDRPCWGFSQGEADDRCCSAYCHILEWDRDTGKMNGRCESHCELRGAACSGKSQVKADAKCCSGSCDVEGVDEKGKLYGTCDKATPLCKPVTATCSGKHINDADAACCSGNCGYLVFFDGEYHGRCNLLGEDGQSDSKQPASKSQQNSAGEA